MTIIKTLFSFDFNYVGDDVTNKEPKSTTYYFDVMIDKEKNKHWLIDWVSNGEEEVEFHQDIEDKFIDWGAFDYGCYCSMIAGFFTDTAIDDTNHYLKVMNYARDYFIGRGLQCGEIKETTYDDVTKMASKLGFDHLRDELMKE